MATLAGSVAGRSARSTILREIGIASTAGALAGILVGGIGGRVAMRIAGAMSDPSMIGGAVTDNGNILGQVTFGGTFALVVFVGLIPGVLGGVLYLAVRPWLRPLGRWAGLIFGSVLLAALGSTVLEPFNIDFRKFGSPGVNVALFALLFPAFGISVAALIDLLERRSRAGASFKWEALSLVGLGIAFLGLAPFVISTIGSLIEGDRADLRPFIPAYWLIAALGLRWVFSRAGAFEDVRHLSRRDALLSSLALALPAIVVLPATLYAITFLARP